MLAVPGAGGNEGGGRVKYWKMLAGGMGVVGDEDEVVAVAVVSDGAVGVVAG